MNTKETVKGIVTESRPGTKFDVRLGDDRVILCAISGKMYQNHIYVVPGDRVDVILSPDGRIGRIVRRL